MNKKYKLTSETKKNIWGVTLFRVEALVSFGSVEKGQKGGWIEKEENLSKEGNAWVYGNAQVYGDARVSGDAWVFGKIKLTLGYFFGWREKEEELTFIDNGDGDELIGKGDCEFEYYKEEKQDSATTEAIALLKKNGYEIVRKA